MKKKIKGKLNHNLLSIRVISLCLITLLTAACTSPITGKNVNQTETLASNMAEMGQIMDRFYRIYNSPGMRQEEIELLNQMIDLQARCIYMPPKYIENSGSKYKEELTLYQHFGYKSLRILKEMKDATEKGDYTLLKSLLDELDSTRRNAHQHFG